MKIVGVHGINTDGDGNIGILLAELERQGFETSRPPVPWRHWFSARWGGCSDGKIVAQHSSDGDIIVAHSYGCLRAWHAHHVRDYKAIICIAPAMSKTAEWQQPIRTHCYHSDGDWAVRLGARLLLHPFGAAGVEGFNQLSPHGNNHGVQSDHSGYFSDQFGLLHRIAHHVAHLARLSWD